MDSRSLLTNFIGMAQIEKMNEERMKEEKNLYSIMETITPQEPMGARLGSVSWLN
jgi:hypothetical protein